MKKDINPLLQAFKELSDEILTRRARKKTLSILHSTNWKAPSDVDINQLALIHQKLIRTKKIRDTGKGVVNPFFCLLRALESIDGSGINRNLRHLYMMWRTSTTFNSQTFSEFLGDERNFSNIRVHGHERERILTNNQMAARRKNRNERYAAQRKFKKESPSAVLLHRIAEMNAPDAPERYFEALTQNSENIFRRNKWLDLPTPYPGREHIDVAKKGAFWFPAMREWLKHRARQYETNKDQRMALHVLADYVFLYLPWWLEKHPETEIKFPTSPRQFFRHWFISRTIYQDEGQVAPPTMPKTLTELLPSRRRTRDTRNSTFGQWYRFFQYVITAFEDNEQVAGKRMVNPIRLDFDRVKSSRRNKTNKVPFSEDVYPYLVLFAQAIEAFGEFLQLRAYEDNIFDTPLELKDGYDTETWGYVPIVCYRGQVHPVRWISNIYTISKRVVASNPPDEAGLYINGWRINPSKDKDGNDYENRLLNITIPHLTVVRMLLAIIETGLRAQSIQWLDRNSWDSLNRYRRPLVELHTWSPSTMFTKLLVNTDKSNDEPWTTFIPWRVRRAFLAEQYFQESLFTEPKLDMEVDYENRRNSRFGRVTPLFRSNKKATPIADATYSNRWVDFLTAFETFYNNRTNIQSVDFEPLRTLDVKVSQNPEENQVVKYSALHTPHACRATYATLKDGDLEVSEIARQLGHANTVVTNYYQVPSDKRVLDKVEKAEKDFIAGIYDVDGKGDAYVHTERHDSAVRQAFNRDREATIQQFGFVPGVAIWSISELESEKSDSIELLQQSASSAIKWHPTHVCPVGNQCPNEVVVRTGGFLRCGLCPLAAKCIDHLPAIAAKTNELKERIRTSAKRIQAFAKKGVSQTTIDALHGNMELDTKELMGWQLASEILREKLERLGSSDETYHVEQPEIVRRHLQLVTKNASESAFYLQRISESNAYPSLESDEIRARAGKYIRLILAHAGHKDDAAFLDLEPHSELAEFASLVKTMAAGKQISISDIEKILTQKAPTQIETAADIKLLHGDV